VKSRISIFTLGMVLGIVLPARIMAEIDTDVIELTSTAFEHAGDIPSRFTCDGDDVSPALVWKDIPVNAKSLVLIVDDPDVPDPADPERTWVHWVLYDIPPAAGGLAEAMPAGELPPGTRPGKNDWGRTDYGGPCPPIGKHRYFFKLYALDSVLGDLGYPSAGELEKAVRGHTVAVTELVGRYQRK
jgi:Raf kinase inhibitor-like YbhB/YbcL family protein